MLYGRLVRSPHAHARVRSIDVTAAQKVPRRARGARRRISPRGRRPSRQVEGGAVAAPDRALRGPADRRGRRRDARRRRRGRAPREGRLRGLAVRRRSRRGEEARRAARLPGPRGPASERRRRRRRGRSAADGQRARAGADGERQRRRGGAEGRRRPRRHDVPHAGPDALGAGDARRRRRLEGRPAHRLRVDAGHAHGAGRARDGVRPEEEPGPRHHRVHGRRLRREVRRRQLRRPRDAPLEEGRRAGAAHARSQRRAPRRRQPAEQRAAAADRREQGRDADRDPSRVVRHGRHGRRRRARAAR